MTLIRREGIARCLPAWSDSHLCMWTHTAWSAAAKIVKLQDDIDKERRYCLCLPALVLLSMLKCKEALTRKEGTANTLVLPTLQTCKHDFSKQRKYCQYCGAAEFDELQDEIDEERRCC